MKTLEQLLQNGTTSEKELVKLAHRFPTNPEKILNYELASNVTGAVLSAALTAWGISVITHSHEIIGGAMAFFGGFGVYGNIGDFRGNRLVKRILADNTSWPGVVPQTADSLFYQHKDKFTYAPTPVEVKLGTRVCAIDQAVQLESWHKYTLAFLGKAYVAAITHQDYEVESTASAGDYPTPVTVKEKRTRSQLTLQHDDEKFDLQIEQTPEMLKSLAPGDQRSFLLSVYDGKVLNVEKIYTILDDAFLNQPIRDNTSCALSRVQHLPQ